MSNQAHQQQPSEPAKTTIEALLALINSAARDAALEYEKTGHGVPSMETLVEHPLDSSSDTLALKKAIRVLESACERLCSTLAQPMHTIINRSIPYEAACLRVVAEVHVADILAEHPDGLHVDNLSLKTGIESGKLARVMRLLATRSCFSEVKKDVFANNRLSLSLLSSNYLSDAVGLMTDDCVRGAGSLYDVLVDPIYGPSYDPKKSPFMYSVKEEFPQGVLYDWYELHPKHRERFERAMIGWGTFTGSLSVLHDFPWGDKKTVCDVGSGIGAFAMPLARAYPHLHITLQDLPSSIENAKKVWNEEFPDAIQRNQISFAPLDFLKGGPVAGQDIYYMRFILHNWPDAEALVILKNIRAAMSQHSRLLIHDYILPPLHREQETSNTFHSKDIAPEPLLPNYGSGSVRIYSQDLLMLSILNAKERSLSEIITLGLEAGFQLEKDWDCAELRMVEFKVKDD